MAKNTLLAVIVTALVVGAGSFFGGIQYGKGRALVNLSPEQMRTTFQRTGANIGSQAGNFRQGAITGRVNAVMGEIIAKDEQSITVKLQDGGSKIVFFSEQTIISKTAASTINELQVGENIVANGSVGQDNVFSATNIQLRPVGFENFAPRAGN